MINLFSSVYTDGKKPNKDNKKDSSNTSKKQFTKASAVELLSVVAIILLLIFVNNVFKVDGILYQTLRLLIAIFIYIFAIKVRLHFLISTNFNEKGVNILELFKEYKKVEYGLTADEVPKVIALIVEQENSKHQKVIRREYAERIAIALLIIGFFALGV